MNNSLPIVDLKQFSQSEEDKEALANQVCGICHHIGFFVVQNHGINPNLMKQGFDLSKRFFDLPTEQKLLIDKKNSPWFRGWEGIGSEYTNNRPDYREQIDLWTDHSPVRVSDNQPNYLNLLGHNQWLPESVIPGYKGAIENLIFEFEKLAGNLMQLLAIGLELPEDYFESLFGEKRMSLLKIIRYPATPTGEFGVNPHHDTGFLTILNPSEQPGLEIQLENGDWIPVPHIKDALVINLGEMLQAMCGNYFVATPHRVVTQAPRQSIGYFHGPSLDTKLTRIPLASRYTEAVNASPRHQNAGFMAPITETQEGVVAMGGSLQADTYGDQVWNYFCRSYPDNVKRFYPDLIN